MDFLKGEDPKAEDDDDSEDSSSSSGSSSSSSSSGSGESSSSSEEERREKAAAKGGRSKQPQQNGVKEAPNKPGKAVSGSQPKASEATSVYLGASGGGKGKGEGGAGSGRKAAKCKPTPSPTPTPAAPQPSPVRINGRIDTDKRSAADKAPQHQGMIKLPSRFVAGKSPPPPPNRVSPVVAKPKHRSIRTAVKARNKAAAASSKTTTGGGFDLSSIDKAVDGGRDGRGEGEAEPKDTAGKRKRQQGSKRASKKEESDDSEEWGENGSDESSDEQAEAKKAAKSGGRAKRKASSRGQRSAAKRVKTTAEEDTAMDDINDATSQPPAQETHDQPAPPPQAHVSVSMSAPASAAQAVQLPAAPPLAAPVPDSSSLPPSLPHPPAPPLVPPAGAAPPAPQTEPAPPPAPPRRERPRRRPSWLLEGCTTSSLPAAAPLLDSLSGDLRPMVERALRGEGALDHTGVMERLRQLRRRTARAGGGGGESAESGLPERLRDALESLSVRSVSDYRDAVAIFQQLQGVYQESARVLESNKEDFDRHGSRWRSAHDDLVRAWQDDSDRLNGGPLTDDKRAAKGRLAEAQEGLVRLYQSREREVRALREVLSELHAVLKVVKRRVEAFVESCSRQQRATQDERTTGGEAAG